MEGSKLTPGKNHEDCPMEQMRRSLLAVTSENTILKENIAEMEKIKYDLYKRITKLLKKLGEYETKNI